MARPGRPERNRAARSFRQLRRFHHAINSDKVFGTHKGALSRVPAIAVSLSALAVIGAVTANSLPNFNCFSLPNFNHFSLPNFNRFASQSPHETASAPIPDPAVSATLKDIQLSQQQNAAVLVSLTQSSATLQADLKRISRQISSLAAQADALQRSE